MPPGNSAAGAAAGTAASPLPDSLPGGADSRRVFLVTGANTGIGLATATELARQGGAVYLACRSQVAAELAAATVTSVTGNREVRCLALDLADLSSVRACAQAFLAQDRPLHVLVNNAGVAGPRGLTRDGFELAFGVNHLGHYALTCALADRLVDSAPARVITVASDSHYGCDGIDFTALRRKARRSGKAYDVSKLCNVLFSEELARRAADRGVTACALHPGVVASDIWRRVPWPVRPLLTARMLSTQEGARTSVYCATAADGEVRGGAYYADCAEIDVGPAVTAELGAALWEHSAAWTGISWPA